MATRKTKLQTAGPEIVQFFETSHQGVWTRRGLGSLLSEMRGEWQLAPSMPLTKFLDFLVSETSFVRTVLAFPYLFEFAERFWWGEPTVYKLAMSLYRTGYFSHHSALFLHELVDQEPKTVYFNIEQQAEGTGSGRLQQRAIDAAFQKPARISNNRVAYNEQTICLLSGKNTQNLGVCGREWPEHGTLRVTNIERTLIDCAVRPIYGGGPLEILKAYKNASDKVSPKSMAVVLKELRYIYPYNQAVGFYLDKTGAFNDADLDSIREAEMTHDFYLDYEMVNPRYSHKWRLYYPAERDT